MLRSSQCDDSSNTREYNVVYVFSYAITLTLGSFQIGYILFLTTVPSLTFYLKEVQILRALINYIVPSIAFITCLVTCLTIRIFSKRQTIIYSNIILIIATGLMFCVGPAETNNGVSPFSTEGVPPSQTPGPYLLLSSRILQGIPVGFFSVVIPLYLREISPKEAATSTGILHQIMIFAGAAAAQSFGFSEFDARLVSIPIVCVAVIQICLFLFRFKVDSPKHQLYENTREAAFNEIEHLYTNERRISNEIVSLDDEHKDQKYKRDKYSDLSIYYF